MPWRWSYQHRCRSETRADAARPVHHGTSDWHNPRSPAGGIRPPDHSRIQHRTRVVTLPHARQRSALQRGVWMLPWWRSSSDGTAGCEFWTFNLWRYMQLQYIFRNRRGTLHSTCRMDRLLHALRAHLALGIG